MLELSKLGFDDFFSSQLLKQALAPGLTLGRVVQIQKNLWQVHDGNSCTWCALGAAEKSDRWSSRSLPIVGDFVAFKGGGGRGLIARVFERKNAINRVRPGGGSDLQYMAANLDRLFIVTSLNADLNARRLERYLVLAHDAEVPALILLTKADLCEDLDAALSSLKATLQGQQSFILSSQSGQGYAELAAGFRSGETIAFLGSSGVGKSTIINRLLDPSGALPEIAPSSEISAHRDKGRHTTSSRQLFSLPSGAHVIDMPGLREIQLSGDPEAVAASFEEIDAFRGACRFRDCRHDGEPGCAVTEAIASGDLSSERLKSFRKLERELAHAERKGDKLLQIEEKKRYKRIHKSLKKHYRT